jgi:hypothetical protein
MNKKNKNKPKYVICYTNQKNKDDVIGVASLSAYNEFLSYLFHDPKIKRWAGFEYKDAEKIGLTKHIEVTLLGSDSSKNKTKKNKS